MRTFLPAMWRGVLHPRQPRLEEREPRLHEHDENGRDDDPEGVRGDQQLVVSHPRRSSCAVVDDVRDGRGPAEAVAGGVAGAGGVGDRGNDPIGERVVDDEGEERLRQEPRLERAAPVLVRHSALAPVPDRLDDRDPDVAGLLLDGVDHRLDPLPHDHRLDLDQRVPSLWTNEKSPATAQVTRLLRPSGRLLRRTACRRS